MVQFMNDSMSMHAWLSCERHIVRSFSYLYLNFATFFISRIVTNLPRVQGEIPLLFFPRTFWYKIPLILYNADKRNAKNTLISDFADKTVRAVSANY